MAQTVGREFNPPGPYIRVPRRARDIDNQVISEIEADGLRALGCTLEIGANAVRTWGSGKAQFFRASADSYAITLEDAAERMAFHFIAKKQETIE